jgi:hypothetical protein
MLRRQRYFNRLSKRLQDPAEMAQLVPIIEAPVGTFVYYRLIKKLGKTAMKAYRLRLQKQLN